MQVNSVFELSCVNILNTNNNLNTTNFILTSFQKIWVYVFMENFRAVSYQLLRSQVKINKTRLQITIRSKILLEKLTVPY